MADYDDAWKKGKFTSRNGFLPEKSDVNAMILQHLRAAQQGASYFISFTTTTKPIFGSTGIDFYKPENGQVVIDLAKVDQKRIYDVHSVHAINSIITSKDLEWGKQFVEGDDDYERNAAARDTMRTRELLIEGKVPAEAIVAIRRSDKHNGKWRDLDGTATLTADLPENVLPEPK